MIELTILFVRYVILKPFGLYKEEVDDTKFMREWLVTIGYFDRHKRK